MPTPTKDQYDVSLERYRRSDPELYRELLEKTALPPAEEGLEAAMFAAPVATRRVVAEEGFETATPMGRRMVETIVRPNARPVMVIRDNRATTDFLGPDSQVWAARVQDATARLDLVIPAVGRVEIGNNPDYPWAGTGWLVDDGIVVTNRHVARLFAARGGNGFRFRIGPNGPMTARIDYLEEYQRAAELEFMVSSILWIAPGAEPDVAFLRVSPRPGRVGPKPITLASAVGEDDFVAAIGYPARDGRVPDQDLVRRIFGDVYEKKRLAPGQVMTTGAEELEHDCSTLGGNSGSVLVHLETGEAVGLHFAGSFLEANYAVPAPKLKELLEKARSRGVIDVGPANGRPPAAAPAAAEPGAAGTYTLRFDIPVEVTVRVGGAVPSTAAALLLAAPGAPKVDDGSVHETAVSAARATLARDPAVLDVRLGYRFKRGWITDERVIVVDVREKVSMSELHRRGIPAIPPSVLGVGVDVRTAALATQLESFGVDLDALEAPPRPGRYREPPHLSLDLVRERMKAVFHVSPDSGFPNLRAFLGRVRRQLTATMYEWEAHHVSDAVAAAVRGDGATLRMVTQLSGTESAVRSMKQRLGQRFDHAWASVGAGRLFPMAYHIKVASRDDQEFWLSSGNWKNSGQADIDPAGEDSTRIGYLRDHNREWHALIENERLAKLFREYIEWDFQEAERVPLDEIAPVALPDVFLPIEALEGVPERAPRARYFDPLVLDRVLEVQPLLTPDRDSRGNRMFMDAAIALVKRGERRVYIENQAFNLLKGDGNTDEFLEFMEAVGDRQRAGVDVRIIFRDPREYPGGAVKLQDLLERLKDFGIDTDQIRVQRGCHTKGIVVDGAEVLLGSHNLTNMGTLFNRDASLLVRDEEVAAYFEQIFLFDWDTLAVQQADELVGGMRIAAPGEETPAGFRRVSLSELLADD